MAVAAHSRSGDNVGEPMRLKLTAFAHTLRGNGFKVGLAETADALSILVMSAADKPATLEPALRALFCATRSDWERFDEIFEAFWLARGIRQARVLAGAAPEGAAPVRALKDVGPRGGKPGLPDHVERRQDDGGYSVDGRGKREGASRAENLASIDLRYIVNPEEIRDAHALAERLALCPRQFTRRFQQEFGSSPASFVRRMRLDEARQRLSSTDCSVEEVARSVGFSDGDNFRRAFERCFHVAPREYRGRFAAKA